MRINWKQKLSSRRFWAAVAGFITALTAAFGIEAMNTEHIIAIISALGVLVAYIIGESCVDSARAKESPKQEALISGLDAPCVNNTNDFDTSCAKDTNKETE